MTNSGQKEPAIDFESFEGMWLMAKPPSGAIACAKVVDGRLLIPFAFSEQNKPAGHFYGCRLIEGKLCCRFEQFDSAVSGGQIMKIGPNQTLIGNRWNADKISPAVLSDISTLHESLPGKQEVVWVRILKKETPLWAEKYFSEDWPNKSSI